MDALDENKRSPRTLSVDRMNNVNGLREAATECDERELDA